MHIWIITLFPEYFSSLEYSIAKRAANKGKVVYHLIDLRPFGVGKHLLTDDRPYGGGPGMIMLVEPISRALESIKAQAKGSVRTILTSAKGSVFTQKTAQDYAKVDNLVIICGHYGGVDERVSQLLIDQEVRIGNFVLTGGEPAAVVMIDAVVRLVPGVLGNEQSTQDESHSEIGFSGAPQYSKPFDFNGVTVPEVLLSGDHQKIADWRQSQRFELED